MKKIITTVLVATAVLSSTSLIANAATGTWEGNATGSRIRGQLYLTNGYKDKANASTQNLSQNGHKAYLQMYCYKSNGITDSSSVRTKVGTNSNKYDVGADSSCKSPGIWESLHSTSGTNDKYYGLRIQV